MGKWRASTQNFFISIFLYSNSNFLVQDTDQKNEETPLLKDKKSQKEELDI